jgi:hypothetical protein
MSTFVHLHVASGYSMQYGASTPAALVARAAAFGQPALALTDRDGLYGAVRFVQACTEAKIAPILGVDLAVHLPPSDPDRPVCRPPRLALLRLLWASTGSASASTGQPRHRSGPARRRRSGRPCAAARSSTPGCPG